MKNLWPVFTVLLVCIAVCSFGCLSSFDHEVVVYAALDKEFSQPILTDLEQEMGLRILTKFDQESNKTAGLVTDIIQNQTRPRTDVFWNNEILHTLRLEKLGLLEVYRSPAVADFPHQFVSDRRTWHGFAARARVLIVNTDLIPDPAARPTSIEDLANPVWKDKCAMARPLFGTTATHAAVLFDRLGNAAAIKLLTEIANNAAILGGNKQVAQKVASGQFAFGITDTDDAIIELENAQSVALVFPDQSSDQMGTLLIPNTLCIIKNGPNTERAKRLVDRLLQPDIETRLAEGRSAQIPLNQSVIVKSRVEPVPFKTMQSDFSAAADQWESVSKILVDIFPVGGG
jgi:iron(III) transport system substrate-binding protein